MGQLNPVFLGPDGNEKKARVSSAGEQLIEVVSSALPEGASTSANQTTANGLLTDIKANQTNGNQVTKIKETLPTDALNTNPILALDYDGAGLLSTLTKTIGAVQYRKTLTYTSGVLSGVSEWVQL